MAGVKYISPIPNNNFAFSESSLLIGDTRQFICSNYKCPICDLEFKSLKIHFTKNINPSHMLVCSALKPKVSAINGIELDLLIDFLKITNDDIEGELVNNTKYRFKLNPNVHSELLSLAQRKAFNLSLSRLNMAKQGACK